MSFIPERNDPIVQKALEDADVYASYVQELTQACSTFINSYFEESFAAGMQALKIYDSRPDAKYKRTLAVINFGQGLSEEEAWAYMAVVERLEEDVRSAVTCSNFNRSDYFKSMHANVAEVRKLNSVLRKIGSFPREYLS